MVYCKDYLLTDRTTSTSDAEEKQRVLQLQWALRVLYAHIVDLSTGDGVVLSVGWYAIGVVQFNNDVSPAK